MSNKKIVFLTPTFSRGGAEKNILNIINSLDNTFAITLIVCTSDIEYTQWINKDIDLIVLNKNSVSKSIPKIIKYILSIRPQIVFTSALHLAVPILFYRLFTRLPFIKITRIPSLPSNKLEVKSKAWISKFLEKGINLSDVIIAQSDEMNREIVSFYNCESSKVITIGNLVDTNSIFKAAEEKVILSNNFNFLGSGSLYSVKGFDLLLKAFKLHLQYYPSDQLYILGKESVEKNYEEFLKKLALDLGISNSVQFLGHQSNPYPYYKQTDAFVLSSIKEGMPNVVLENIALGTPVLVTNCINFESIIKPNQGLIIEKNSVSALCKGLKEIRNFKRYTSEVNNFDYNGWFTSLLQKH